MTKTLLGVLLRVLTSFILLAGATLASAQSRPTPSCTLPHGCSNGSCTISTEWIRDNQDCPERKHDAIVIHKGSKLHIEGGVVFKVEPFKQYQGTIGGDGKIQCDWSTRLHPAKPFDDVTTASIGVPAVDLNTYSQVHVLKAKNDCVGCYKVNFSVQGAGTIDPHIQAGGSGRMPPAATACN